MSHEVFRFMTVRPPQMALPQETLENSVELSETDHVRRLKTQKEVGSRSGMIEIAQSHLNHSDFLFIRSRAGYEVYWSIYDDIISVEHDFTKTASEVVRRYSEQSAQEVVNQPEFVRVKNSVSDSIVTAAIVASVSAKNRSLLVNFARILGLLEKLASSNERFKYSRSQFLAQAIILPQGIFPLPPLAQDAVAFRKRGQVQVEKAREASQVALEASQLIESNRRATAALAQAFEKQAASNAVDRTRGFYLSESSIQSLPRDVLDTLSRSELDISVNDISSTTRALEMKSHELAKTVYAGRTRSRYAVKIGNAILSSDRINGTDLILSDAPLPTSKIPGACINTQPDGATRPDMVVSVPSSVGQAHILGFADLMLVEQDLARYELGEISHIENVLKSEVRERSFRTTTTTEETTLSETEIADEKSQDLTTAERFELQAESERVIDETTSKEAGITVNASYGPSVDVNTNYGFSSSTAKHESNRASTNFARDTTARAAAKVQKRTLERRTTRRLQEIVEKNRHSFDNKEGTDNISGIYRFVDKIYRAQVVKYGRRLMFEFMVPEPAAFLRHAKSQQPTDEVPFPYPEPPGYCVNGKFVDLSPQDIDRENYLFWASRYDVEDIDPPPASSLVISSASSKDTITDTVSVSQNAVKLSSSKLDIEIQDGYLAHSAIFNVYGQTQKTEDGIHAVVIQAQNVQHTYVEPDSDKNFFQRLLPTAKLAVTINTSAFHNYELIVTVYCELSKEEYQSWQYRVFRSVMNAYNDKISRYNGALETARIKRSYNAYSGSNPFFNRETEKTELKKGCLSILTNQDFSAFNAMLRNVPLHGYPEIAFADAQAEGRYIQFFENSFEWVNMTYVFYPYFWGNKEDWLMVSQISDDDPLYARFLQAGAARVQVPVRPGFEKAICHYLEGLGIWNGEGEFIVRSDGALDPLYVSVLSEIKETLSYRGTEGPGRLTVERGSTNIIGDNTSFGQEEDENRRISIRGRTYIIKKVHSEIRIELSEKYQGESEQEVAYTLQGKLVGEPWEVRLPTALVRLGGAMSIFES